MKTTILLSTLLIMFLLAACDQKSQTENDVEAQPVKESAISEGEAVSQTGEVRSGKETYDLFCSGCHNPGEGHAGTMKLALLKGEENSLITEQTTLNAEYIRFVVRDGLLEMAPFRPTDINDSELDSLIEYILSEASGKALSD